MMDQDNQNEYVGQFDDEEESDDDENNAFLE